MKKYVYMFEESKASAKTVILLGNKGAQLAEMTRIGLPVPPGFTIATDACSLFYNNKKKLTRDVINQIRSAMKKLEKKLGKQLGGEENPLFVSVRSGSYVSMPGMMDTILNLGMNDTTVEVFAKQINNPRTAWDSYRRFMQMFGNVVMGVEHAHFEKILDEIKERKGVKLDTELDTKDLKQVVKRFGKLVEKKTGEKFPSDPDEQLIKSVYAVFGSWNTKRAIEYRRINKLSADAGTAANVQAMVFGNMGDDSGTGVSFTRNPSTGKKERYGEFLINAQGEDVVAGIRTPLPIDAMKKVLPKMYKELLKVYDQLEKHYRDIQDFEFTIERGKLYLLQTRTGKRTGMAAVKAAVDMVREGLISRKEAILRVKPEQLDQLLHPMIDPKAQKVGIGKGLAASPGAASGKVVFSADDAVTRGENEAVLLVRLETSPDDIHGMNAAKGILTARGGMTSHAAVVARGMGKPCVAGCEEITIDESAGVMNANGKDVKEGDWITINGSTGEIFLGEVPTIQPKISKDFNELMGWADKVRKLNVRANADIPSDAAQACKFGAEGIGLCRTEHMFFHEDRVAHMRAMILAKDTEKRKEALFKLLPMQKADFLGLFKEMKGLPVTIRLLDPPLHEFLPKHEELLVEITKMEATKGNSTEIEKKKKLLQRVEQLREFNPMLGHRGCRLGITYPEISEMQARAIFQAACELAKKGKKVIPEVMIPLVSSVEEFRNQCEIVNRMARECMEKYKVKVKYLVGTMIELPRACVTADQIAQEAEFFSFGTNDLTQTTSGFSRDDAAKFLTEYQQMGLMKNDPFAVLDQNGVGQLVRMGVEKGRGARKNLKIGICGEHGGEPASVEFCHRIGLDYVSCSPFRVPIARLAAAHAALKDEKPKKTKKATTRKAKKAKKRKR